MHNDKSFPRGRLLCAVICNSCFFVAHLLFSLGACSYLRVERRNQTFCLLCETSDTIASLKTQLALAASQHSTDGVDADQMRLLLDTTVLEDDSTIAGLELKDDAVLYLVYAVADNEYESVDVVSTAFQEG